MSRWIQDGWLGLDKRGRERCRLEQRAARRCSIDSGEHLAGIPPGASFRTPNSMGEAQGGREEDVELVRGVGEGCEGTRAAQDLLERLGKSSIASASAHPQ